MTEKKHGNLKLIAGTNRRDRAAPDSAALPPLDAVPPAPSWLPAGHARHEWSRLAPVLHANGLLSEGNTGTLAHYCSLSATLVQAWSCGSVPTAALISAFRGLQMDLRLGAIAAVKAPAAGNKFARNAIPRRA